MKDLCIYTIAAFVIFATTIGCQVETDTSQDVEAETDTVSVEQISQQISSQNDAFMAGFEEGDTTRFAQVYFEDGWMMPPNAEPIKGRAGIKQFLTRGKAMGLERVELTRGELFVHGDSVAIETGSFKTYANGSQVDHGTFMVYWRKDGDTWRMYRDIWNSDVQPEQPEE